MIHAWENYPARQFPGLWVWIATQVETKMLAMPRVAFDEVAHKAPDCCMWLKDHELELMEVSNEIIQDALRIKGLLGIVNDRYHPKGVDENDLLIVATARAHGVELVSDEAKQSLPPATAAKRKIPAVCDMPHVSVACIPFIEYIRRSDEIFR